MADQLWQHSAVDLAAGIREKTFSSLEVITSVLNRVAEHNPRLNAIVQDLGEEALEQAKAADATLARGTLLGPLHGVPVTIKVNVDQAGKATTNGIPAFADAIAAADSPVVGNLRKAGAIIIGRTNTPELSMRATTDNPLHGRTLNPWQDLASPGGSSGGAGCAAAAGFGPIHHGNDIGGSLRFPSFACGVSTVKPTLGRVPAYNPSMTVERGMLAQLMSVQGAICREVKDVRLALEVMSAGDARDPWWVPAPFADWPKEESLEDSLKKVALTKESYGYPIHDGINNAIDQAAEHLQAAGYHVEEVATPSMADPAQGWFDVAVYEIRATLGPIAREYGSATVQKIFDWYYTLGELVDAEGYRDRIAERTRYTREWNIFLDEYPLVLSPFLMRPTYDWNYDELSERNTHDLFQSALYSVGINYLSLPAGIVPMGLIDDRPAAVQVIGRRFREDLILDALEAIEDRQGVLTRQLWERA